jgi:transmembrane sensor
VSNAGGEVAPAPALDVDAQAADFLIRRTDQTHWSASDEQELEAWLSQSLAHMTAYWRLESVWDRAYRLNALKPQSPQRDFAPPPRRTLLFGIAAAVVTVVALGTSAGFLLLQGGPKTYATPVGGRELIKLSDGSRIELNTDTVLRTQFAGGRRHVELVKGEAFFQIKHDAANPFVVTVANRQITDLGTKFVIRRSGDGLKVALLEGSARLTSGNDKRRATATILKPGEVVVATARGFSVTRKSLGDLNNDLSWQRGMLVFHRATLLEVANEYNRYNEQKIVIADAVTGARVINATLPATDVGAFARMAQNFLGLSVEYRNDEVVISR